MIAALWVRAKSWLALLGAALLILVGAYAAGGRAARRSSQLDAVRKAMEERERADEAVAKVDRMGDDAVRERARERMRHNADS